MLTETEKALIQVTDKIYYYYSLYSPYIAPYMTMTIIQLDLNIRIPEHAPSNALIPVEISTNLGSTTMRGVDILIPGGQIWILTEPYTSEIPKIDGKIQIFKNGREPIDTLQLSKISVKIPNRATFSQPIIFEPGNRLSINFVPKKSNKSNKTIVEKAMITTILIDFTYPSYVNLLPLATSRYSKNFMTKIPQLESYSWPNRYFIGNFHIALG